MESLKKKQVQDVIEGKAGSSNIPILYSEWIYSGVFTGNEKKVEEWLKQQPNDVDSVFLNMPDLLVSPKEDPDYRWASKDMDVSQEKGLDAHIVLSDWEDVNDIYSTFPNPEYENLIPNVALDSSKYILARWWDCLFERHWSLRGMENALTDFYLYPDEVHELYQRLTDFYIRVMERARHELKADGLFISDDIGTQKAPFFSLEIFREFFKPYYKQIFDKAHELGMHFWLHSCGNIELYLEDFIEIGLDVLHPIQKYTMEDRKIADICNGRICLFVGFDVQQIIPFGTPQEVREEVRHLIDTYARPEGRLMLTMGNGATPDWKFESLEALYDETIKYGAETMKRLNP